MHNAKKIYAILDTETTFEQKKVYNIGYLIINSKGFVIAKREMLFTDILEADRPFYAGKIPQTAEKIKSDMGYGKMLADFENYEVTTIIAYNATFDISAIDRMGLDLREDFEILDLWSLASQLICNQAYIKWALKNARLTEKGNIKTGAEVVYQYISGLTDFEEDHTALSDCYIELEIWRAVLRKKVKIADLENQSHPWRIVAELRAELGL